MRARTTWLSEAEKSRIADQAMELLAGVGMRFAGSAVLPELAARGARVDEDDRHRAPAARAGRVGARAVPAPRSCSPGRRPRTTCSSTTASPSTSRRAAASPRRSTSAPGVRRASTLQDLREMHRPQRRAAAARRHVDAGLRHGRAPRAARARGVLHDAHRDAQARHVRRPAGRPGRRRPHLRAARRRPRALPRAAADLDGAHRGLAAADRRAGARHPRRPRPARRARPRLHDVHRRGDLAGHPGRLRRPGRRRVPRRRHGAAGRGARRPARLLFRYGRARHAAHHLLDGQRRERPHGRHGDRGGPLPRRADLEPRLLDRQQAARAAGRLREGAEDGGRLLRQPRHHLRLGPARLAQHDVPAAVGGRQRDRRDGPAPAGSGGGLRRDPGGRSRSPRSAPAAASSAERETAKRIRAGEHFLPTVSNRHSYEKWVEEGVTENDVAEAEVERLLAKHAERSCLEADKIDELAAICGVDDESVRRARRE